MEYNSLQTDNNYISIKINTMKTILLIIINRNSSKKNKELRKIQRKKTLQISLFTAKPSLTKNNLSMKNTRRKNFCFGNAHMPYLFSPNTLG